MALQPLVVPARVVPAQVVPALYETSFFVTVSCQAALVDCTVQSCRRLYKGPQGGRLLHAAVGT